MATPLDKIFSKFLHQIDDVELALIDDEELEEILLEFLENSIIDFNECEKEINIIPSYKEEFEVEFEYIPSDTDLLEDMDPEFTSKIYSSLSLDIPYKKDLKFELYQLVEDIDEDFSVDMEESDNDITDDDTHTPDLDDTPNEDEDIPNQDDNTNGDNDDEIVDEDFNDNPDVSNDTTINYNINKSSIKYSKIQLVEGTDYTLLYSEEDEILEVFFIRPIYFGSDAPLYISASCEGYIQENLDLDEIAILAYGMVLSWLNPKIRREENLRQLMNDRDFKQLSNANLLAKLIELHKYTRQELELRRQKYSFKNFKGFD